MVEDVVTINPELESDALLEREVLAQREIDLREIWPHEGISSFVAERPGSWLGEGCHVIPVLNGWVAEARVTDNVRKLGGARSGVIRCGIV